MIRQRGYQTAFLTTGILQGVVIVVVAQFLCHPPRTATTATTVTAGAAGPSVPRLGRHDYTTSEMLRTPQFYVLYAMFVMMATGGLLVTANAGPIAASWGIPAAALAAATSFNALANGGSRIFWGWVSDGIGRELTMGIAFTLQALCLVLALTVGRRSGTLFTVTLIFTFFTWGEIFSLFPALVADYFGVRSSTANYGVLYSAKGVAAIIGGGVAALLYERFGTWTASFYGSAALALMAAMIAFGLRLVGGAGAVPLGVPATVK